MVAGLGLHCFHHRKGRGQLRYSGPGPLAQVLVGPGFHYFHHWKGWGRLRSSGHYAPCWFYLSSVIGHRPTAADPRTILIRTPRTSALPNCYCCCHVFASPAPFLAPLCDCAFSRSWQLALHHCCLRTSPSPHDPGTGCSVRALALRCRPHGRLSPCFASCAVKI